MKFAIIALAALAALYVFLILAPAILFYIIIFKKHWYGEDFEALNRNNPYFSAFADEFESAAAFISTLKKEDFKFTLKDGVCLFGALYRAEGFKTAVFLHGYNTPPLNNFCLQAKTLYESGFSIVFICQRSHGKSGGRSTMGIKEADDLLEILPYIKEITEAKQMLIYGMSMGCTALSYASGRLDSNTVKGIVLDCGFTSPYNQLCKEMARRHLPKSLIAPLLVLFTKKFLKIDITESTAGSLKKAKIPALFFHGKEDITVPFSEGEKSFAAYGGEKTRYAVCAAHTLCYPAGGGEAESLLKDFIKKHFN